MSPTSIEHAEVIAEAQQGTEKIHKLLEELVRLRKSVKLQGEYLVAAQKDYEDLVKSKTPIFEDHVIDELASRLMTSIVKMLAQAIDWRE